jgi:predicted CxxxxCH...CXXCH cytochrome family protein
VTSIRLAVLALAAAALATGCDTARPIAAGANTSAAERCGVCHGYPPPPFIAGNTTHPASTSCYLCHPSTVDAAGNIVAGGTHMNGRVDVGTHPIPYVAQHTGPALSDLNACKVCHGNDFSGGDAGVSCTKCHGDTLGFSDWQTNCTFCHGTRTQGFVLGTSPLPLAAPPRGAHGETDPTVAAVGAHQKHLGNGSSFTDGVDCAECHAVPADLAHVTGAPATLTFGALATQGGLAPSFAGGSCSATYCHGSGLVGGADTTPVWTSPGSVLCGDCHGSPPATGRHVITAPHLSRECSACHALVATSTATPGIQNTPAAKALHVNGLKDVNLIVDGTWDPVAKSCSNVACHTLPPATRFWSP